MRDVVKNPKSEYRNPKQARNTNVQNGLYHAFLSFAFLSFEIVSDFGIRISDFYLDFGF